jgi:hypothetical protein
MVKISFKVVTTQVELVHHPGVWRVWVSRVLRGIKREVG